ncbi:hypothetical protein C8N40_1097 [Pontibacter mucosus]|uniref:Glycosyltransferase 2-like domain-containing protein n=1 Tax=Pontibacter mucosus TaxID=1649266 RepID=A0A2T5YDW4_9BACT|nr:glycosyltransferase family 2 protein [Pontibacter mucosus]PTX14910.1 hypothetical protein C8N40_1097 [Pontibacter mucosus]
MDRFPQVFIILVNYKSWQDTIECLESLFKMTYTNFKVVVVDNDSQNDSIEHIMAWARGSEPISLNGHFYEATTVASTPINKPVNCQYIKFRSSENVTLLNSELVLVESSQNLGFAGGNNIGISLSLANKADYVWLLNNDTVVAKDALSNMIKHINEAKSSNRRLGILGAKLLYYHAPTSIQAILGRYNPLLAKTEHVGFNLNSDTEFKDLTIKDNDYIVGASMFVSKDFIQQVGLMAEEYFLYFEELDWVKRGRKEGYDIDTCLNAIVYHKEGSSIGGGLKDNNNKSQLSDYYSIRNRLIFTKKFHSNYLLPVYISLIFVAVNRIRRKQFTRVPLILKAIKSSLRSTS